ncbi:MAG TPA: hypothetical protein VN181_14370 [Thermoanaerobaculia bacterium]|nr:hypothetical protein [Thermoanaerobaculia bacterium]
MKKLILIFLLSICVRGEASNMARVLEIHDDASIVVERNGVRSTVRLAAIEIVDLHQTTSLLRWTIGSSWVMLEGDAVVSIYRSPDALFVNRELVVRGYARATSPDTEAHRALAVTYLGELDLGPREPVSSARSAPAPRTNKSTSRRSKASRRRAP